MEFKTHAHKPVARICDYCRQNHLPDPGQVRTTKLVYLVEYHYYSWERALLTELDWILWHYGPWSPTLDSILKTDFGMPPEQEPEPGQFRPVHWTKPEFEEPKLRFAPVSEGVLLEVLQRFAAMPYNELLDYVYFETEPMRNAVKGKPLDFSSIRKAVRFVDPVSLLPPRLFHELRKRSEQLEVGEPSVELAADPALLELLVKLDDETDLELQEGTVLVDDNVKSNLRFLLDD